MHTCATCGYKTAHAGNFKRHLSSHTDQRDHVCPVPGCSFACRAVADLASHALTHGAVNGYACSICTYTCKLPVSLRGHMQRHHGAPRAPLRVHMCGLGGCQYSTTRRNVLQQHQARMHDPESGLLLACRLCGYTTAVHMELLLHTRSHNGSATAVKRQLLARAEGLDVLKCTQGGAAAEGGEF